MRFSGCVCFRNNVIVCAITKGNPMPDVNATYSSPKLAAEFRKLFGTQTETIQIKPLYTREVNAFIKRVETAHKATAKSRLVFK